MRIVGKASPTARQRSHDRVLPNRHSSESWNLTSFRLSVTRERNEGLQSWKGELRFQLALE
jgi:hypothetical protein